MAAASQGEARQDDLRRAIGSVVLHSAELEWTLRKAIDQLASSDALWWMFEGQTTEWLLTAFQNIVGELDPWQRRWTPEMHSQVAGLLSTCKTLNGYRRAVVHGQWDDQSMHGAGDKDRRLGRPWGGQVEGLEEPVWWCVRSERGIQGYQERAFTISDIDALAQKFQAASRDLRDLTRELHASRWTSTVEESPS